MILALTLCIERAILLTYLVGDLLLLFSGKIDKGIVLGPNKEGYSRLVEAPPLSVPFLDRVQCALSGQVEHEENCDCIIADEGQHIDELPLPTQIPYRKGYFRVSYRDGLLHEIYTCMHSSVLFVIYIPTSYAVPKVWM